MTSQVSNGPSPMRRLSLIATAALFGVGGAVTAAPGSARRHTRTALAVGIALTLAGGAAAFAPAPVLGTTTFVVNRIGDASDLNLANAACDTSANSGNQCTLRAAIQEANDTSGADIINFNITSTSKVIAPNSPLPPITDPVTINGYSQAGASANTRATGNNAVLKIVLDGLNAGAGAEGLELQGDGSVIRGLVVQRFRGVAILVKNTGHIVSGSFIGTNVAGTTARGNGVGIQVSGSNHTVGGSAPGARNVISGNEFNGVQLLDASNVSVFENYIGTNDIGDAALPNGDVGVRIHGGGNNRIGQAGDGNLISGNVSDGIFLFDTLVNVIQGNRIGTDAAGTGAIANGGSGVEINNATDNDVGGTAVGTGNVISGNFGEGVIILGAGASGNLVARNLIGTKADGTGDLGNGREGVRIESSTNIVGDTVSGAGNVISGNGNSGVILIGDNARFNLIRGNAIRANDQHGVEARKGPNTVIGNVVFSNFESGVLVRSTATRVKIMSNQIFANGELGIDLEGGPQTGAGVSVNDTDDPDTGPNLLQNFPVLTSATRSNTTSVTTITGSLNSNGSTDFTIELFLVIADPSNHGEAQVLLASKQITTSAGGDRSFTFQLGSLSPGQAVTTTATSANGNTSEFSGNVTVVAGP